MLEDLLTNVWLGLEVAGTPQNIAYCFVGAFLGMVVGVLPGLGPLAAISMLFPITFHLDPTSALIMVAGLFYGCSYGGSVTAIMLNVPGTPNGAVACLDGYPMAKAGRGGVALLLTTLGSFFGGSVGIVLMMLFAPVVANWALNFGPTEYFALMCLGLIAAAGISSASLAKGLSMVVFGVLLGLVGMDIYTGEQRFTFGLDQLYDGISLIIVAMGLFGVAEVISSIRAARGGVLAAGEVTFRSMVPTKEELSRFWRPVLRGSCVGAPLGVLPGVGSMIAAFMAYTLEKRVSRHPEQFGKGAVEGISASETANNAADQTSFIPTLTLGVPGSPTMALILGMLLLHGITPGPTMVTQNPDVFWGLVMSFWVGNIILVALNIPLIGLWMRLLSIRYDWLYPIIIIFICIGVFTINNSVFNIWLVAVLGALGFALKYFDLPPAPLVLGFVLGPLMEENFRRAMLMSRGDLMIFFERPISATFIAVIVLFFATTLLLKLRDWKRRAQPPETSV